MKFLSGNLLDVKEGIIVHGCNCQGVWGSGVAKQMKEKYPEAFTKYQSDLKNLGSTALGRVSVWGSMNPVTVHSAFTQNYYGRDNGVRYVSYDAVSTCFDTIFMCGKSNTRNIYIPNLIGAGLGGGSREVILSIIQDSADRFNYDSKRITILKYNP